MIHLIIALRRVGDLRDDNELHRRRQIDAELVVLLGEPQIQLARLVIHLGVAGDEEVRHHTRHQAAERGGALGLAIDVFDVDGLGDDGEGAADVAEVVDGEVAEAGGAELEAEEVEV